jgi:AraC-like DNA-binding protein
MTGSLKFFRGGIFSTDRPYKHISRTISSTELIIMRSGTIAMEIGGERIRAREGDVLRILPKEPHGGFEETPSASFIWLHFDGATPDMLPARLSRPKSLDRVHLLARELLHYERAEGYPEGICECILRALLAEICYVHEEDGSLIASIKEYVRRHRLTGFSASELSESLGYNADYLTRYFKERCGTGLKQYADRIRTEAIKRELLVGGKLSEIGERCGFSDYKSLLKFFKYHTGMSPKEYLETYYEATTN